MNFFDLVNVYTPDVAINYEKIDILENLHSVIFRKNDDILKIKLTHSRDIAFEFFGNTSHIDAVLSHKIREKSFDFQYTLNFAHSFKKLREEQNLKTLNAVIGLLIKYQDNKLVFGCSNHYESYSSNLDQHQILEENISFKKMNDTLSLFYTLDKYNERLGRLINKNVDFNISNHHKMYFLDCFEQYKLENTI